jgi:hypothetical protein
VIELKLVERVSSKIQKTGDTFAFQLAEPIVVDGKVVALAGVSGGGEVIDAAPPGYGGRAAKLVLAARYLMVGDTRVPLQSLKIGTGSGRDYTAASWVASQAIGVGGLLVTGGNVDYPVGTLATAKIAVDITLTPVADSAPPPTTTEPAPQPGPSPPLKGSTP